MIMMKDVYETNSGSCDSLTLERSVYYLSDDEVGAITYNSFHVDSTPMRCCINRNDFVENENACVEEEQTPEITYMWDIDS